MNILAWPGVRHFGVNPYTNALYTHLRSLGVETDDFSFSRAFRKHYDIFHLHWPEHYITRKNPVKAAIGTAMFLAAVSRQRTLGARVVWTVHNLRSHDQVRPALERRFWSLFTGSLDGYICLTESGRKLVRETWPKLDPLPGFAIPHGHYRNEYPNTIARTEARRALKLSQHSRVILHFGSVAPYKNVPKLLNIFGKAFTDDDIALLVAGRCENAEESSEISRLASGDPRIKLSLQTVRPENVQLFFNASDLVVLPFTEILNSGSTILALSFSRPVLVPELGAIPELQKLVGPSWVRTFAPPLEAQQLREAMNWALSPRNAEPDLRGLGWEQIATMTLQAFQSIVNGNVGRSEVGAS